MARQPCASHVVLHVDVWLIRLRCPVTGTISGSTVVSKDRTASASHSEGSTSKARLSRSTRLAQGYSGRRHIRAVWCSLETIPPSSGRLARWCRCSSTLGTPRAGSARLDRHFRPHPALRALRAPPRPSGPLWAPPGPSSALWAPLALSGPPAPSGPFCAPPAPLRAFCAPPGLPPGPSVALWAISGALPAALGD